MLASQPSETERTRAWEQTLEFEDGESIASIVFKLEALTVRDVAIAARPGQAVFRNPVAMRLLQRKAEDLGLNVGFVTRDDRTRSLCAEIGFPVYGNLEGYKRETIRHGFEGLPASFVRAQVASWLSLAAALGLLIVIGLAALFLLPAASITITPAAKTVEADIPVTVDESIEAPDPSAAKIPGRLVTTEVSGDSTVQATGQRDAPDAAAAGFVTFTNKTAQPVSVPPATILLAGPVSFATTQPVTVSPSQTIGSTQIPGTGIAAIQATAGGTDGNVKAGSITAIQGPLANQLTVLNSVATTGGSTKKVGYLSSDDQTKAKEALRQQLLQQGLDKIHSELAAGDTFLPNPDTQSDASIEQLTYTDSPEQVTGQTQVHMMLLIKGLTFHGQDVNQAVSAAMGTAINQQAPGARLQDGAGPSIAPPVVTGNDGSVATLRVHATANVVLPVNTEAAASRVRGLSADQAAASLQTLPGVAQANVQLWPAWASHVPSFSWRIHVALAGASS